MSIFGLLWRRSKWVEVSDRAGRVTEVREGTGGEGHFVNLLLKLELRRLCDFRVEMVQGIPFKSEER